MEPSTVSRKERDYRFAGRLVLELLVVFIGVFGASMLADREARKADEEHGRALRRALATELAFIHAQGRQVRLGTIDAYADAISSGDRPPLQPFSSRIGFSPDVWEAALASGGVRLLEPELMLELSNFYGSMRALLAGLDDHRADTREILLPNLDRPSSEFYDESGALRPKYHWYLEHLRWISRETPALAAKADSLRAVLSR